MSTEKAPRGGVNPETIDLPRSPDSNKSLKFEVYNQKDLPEWLKTPQPEIQSLLPYPESHAAVHLEHLQYDIIFDRIIDKITSGVSLKEALTEDARGFNKSSFLRWIHKDHVRKSRYYEAQEIGSEMVASDIMEIADGNTLEDVQRSTLRINTRKYLLATWNRKRYGETKQIEHTGSISILRALEQADARVTEAIDAEYYELPQSEDSL